MATILDEDYPHLQGFYTFDNIDTQNNTLVATVGPNAPLVDYSTPTGMIGQGIQFSEGFASFGNVAAWKTSEGAVSVWVQVPSHPTDINAGRTLVAHTGGQSSVFLGCTVRTDGKGVIFIAGPGITYTEYHTTQAIGAPGEWVHVIFGSDGTANRIIGNGDEMGLITATGVANQGYWYADVPVTTFELCRLISGAGSAYYGRAAMDHLRILSQWPTEEEALMLYEEPLPYELSGTILQDSSPFIGQVRIYDEASGELLKTVTTEADGSYRKILEFNDPVFVMPVGPSGYRPLVHGPIIPATRNP